MQAVIDETDWCSSRAIQYITDGTVLITDLATIISEYYYPKAMLFEAKLLEYLWENNPRTSDIFMAMENRKDQKEVQAYLVSLQYVRQQVFPEQTMTVYDIFEDTVNFMSDYEMRNNYACFRITCLWTYYHLATSGCHCGIPVFPPSPPLLCTASD